MAGYSAVKRLSILGGQDGMILPCMHFHFKSISKVDKAMIVGNNTYLCDAILVLFLESHPGHRAEISDMNRRQNSSR